MLRRVPVPRATGGFVLMLVLGLTKGLIILVPKLVQGLTEGPVLLVLTLVPGLTNPIF